MPIQPRLPLPPIPSHPARKARNSPTQPRKTAVLVLGQSLHSFAVDLRALGELNVRWTHPDGFARALSGNPDAVLFPARFTEKVKRLVTRNCEGTAIVAVGTNGLFRAQSQGADAVFCVGQRDNTLFWSQAQLGALSKGLQNGIKPVGRRPIQVSKARIRLDVQGTLSPIQHGWFGSGKPIVIERTADGLHYDTSPEGHSVLQVIFRDAEPRTFGGVQHPLREISWFLELEPLAHLEIALEAPFHILDCLMLLSASPRAAQLHGLNPALFWLIVDALARRDLCKTRAVALFGDRQRKVLGELLKLGKNATRGQCKIAKRIRFFGGKDVNTFAKLRMLLANETEVKAWLHWSEIPFQLFVMECPEVRTSLWLSKLKPNPHPYPWAKQIRLYTETLRLAERVDADKARLPRCQHQSQVEELHDQWLAGMNELTAFEVELDRVFPPPPIPAIKGIQYIKNGKELIGEGRKMSHCIALYGESAEAGRCAIYKMTSPERATIQLSQTVRGHWQLTEIKARFNKSVSSQTLSLVLEWLKG